MNISIIGASAGVGLMAVERALERGHMVTTLSRSTDSIPAHKNIIAQKGNATNAEDLKKAFAKADAIIVALGTGSSMKATTLYTDFANAILKVHQTNKIGVPVIVLTGFGAGDSVNYQGRIMRTLMKLMLGAIYKNKTEMEERIAKSSLRWELVRPGMLNNKPRTESYRVVTNYQPNMKIGGISRADVADFLVKQAENPTALGKYPALAD